jgi:hypothetical protein
MADAVRFKRTMPFEKRCCFIVQEWGEIERCEADAEFGLYVGTLVIKLVSLCRFHTIYQESLLIGGKE